jgi:hypothetical protein
VAGTIVLLECNGLSLTESDPSNRDDPEAVWEDGDNRGNRGNTSIFVFEEDLVDFVFLARLLVSWFDDAENNEASAWVLIDVTDGADDIKAG